MIKKVLTGVLVLSTAFTLGFVTDGSDNYFEISKNLDIFGKLYRETNSNYVDDPDPNKLMRTGIDAMLGTLDPYTNFISEQQASDYEFLATGSYAGIGALIGKRDQKLMVLEPYEKYPADVSGLKAGDLLVRVAGSDIDGSKMEVSDVRNLLRGEQGTSVEIVVNRMGQELTFSVLRGNIRIDNVPYYGMVDDRTGYIALTGFTANAGREVEQALSALKKEYDVKQVILDLRGNPGGRLDEAVNVTNVFIPSDQLIVETRGRIGSSKRKHLSKSAGLDTEIPLVVLVNGRSASASEIVAGAIQDLDRGLIVGSRSFGKGLVQNIRPLSYNTQLKVTTAKYYTPSGRCIQAINYAEKNPDGSVARIPDSLQTAFQTRNGRKVLDGGGIEPDVKVSSDSYLTLITELDRQGIIFDFATQFALSNPDIPAPREFLINEELYQTFVAFAKEKQFSYTTDAERRLEALEKTIRTEDYADQLAGTVKTLKRQLEAKKDLDLNLHRDQIIPLIRQEIVKRYYYQRGAIEASFVDDVEIKEALKQFTDLATYRQSLMP